MKWLRKVTHKVRTKKVLMPVGLVVAGFVLVNAVLGAYFWHRTYPNTKVNNHRVGSVPTARLATVLPQKVSLPASFQLKYAEQSLTLKTAEVGAQLDVNQTAGQLAKMKRWLPLANFFVSHSTPMLVSINDQVFDQAWPKLQSTFHQAPVDANISLQNGTFVIGDEVSGYELDKTAVKTTLVRLLGRERATITLPVITKPPAHTRQSLMASVSDLQAQQQTKLTYHYQSQAKTLSAADINQWFVPSGVSLAVSDVKLQTTLSQVGSSFGIRIQNLTEALTATKAALASHKALDFSLTAMPSRKIFTYCVSAKGVDSSYLSALRSKLKSTYADSRGWGLDGDVAFNQVTSGCNFTVWLSAASQMSTFGAICDSDWSCRVGPNVIINFDRWQGASSAWNAAGGSLDDYRSMVINHETGHWLGFGHKHCSGAGQLAPVMQQQSINLEGCKFNPWPLPSELTVLRNSLRL